MVGWLHTEAYSRSLRQEQAGRTDIMVDPSVANRAESILFDAGIRVVGRFQRGDRRVLQISPDDERDAARTLSDAGIEFRVNPNTEA